MSEALERHTAQLEQKVIDRTADLNEAKERVEAILNNSTDGIILVHTDLKIQQTNSSFNCLFACEPDDYFGKSLITLAQIEDADKATKIFQTVTAEQKGNSIEIRAVRKDGTVFDAELSIGPIKDDGLVCTLRDITERKAQERQLRYFASLQESVVDAVIATDTNLHIQTWNRGAERIYGWKADEVIGKTAPDLLQIRQSSAENLESTSQRFIEQGFVQQETIQRRKDDTDIFILGSATLLADENGVPVGVISVNRDITELKRSQDALAVSEQRFRLLVNSLDDYSVIMLDPQGNIKTWNPGAERIKGYTAEEIIGQNIARFYTAEGIARGEPQEVLRIAENEGQFAGERWRVRKDGTQFWAELAVIALRDNENRTHRLRQSYA